MEEGYIDETHREEGAPVSSGRKDLPLDNPLSDVSALDRSSSPPPTMVVAELISRLVQGGQGPYEDPSLSSEVLAKLERIYQRLASTTRDGNLIMSRGDVERYLIAINGIVGRGSEFREAARQMGRVEDDDSEKSHAKLPEDGILTLEGLKTIYDKELKQGKFWGIAHDLAVLGEGIDCQELFVSRFDRIYTSDSISTIAVMDFSSESSCPNAFNPSDHLPIAALFRLK